MSAPPSANAPLYSEVARVPCPAYYSDLVCHFYAHMPSYETVIPNIRGCFSRLANGYLQVPNGDGTSHNAVYPEMWDYCMYQDYDAVLGKTPSYDQATIDANKAAGNEVGVLRYMANSLRPVFKFVMYTWYEPNTFLQSDQQAILNQVYAALGQQVPAPRSGLSTHPDGGNIVPRMVKYFQTAKVPTAAPSTTPASEAPAAKAG